MPIRPSAAALILSAHGAVASLIVLPAEAGPLAKGRPPGELCLINWTEITDTILDQDVSASPRGIETANGPAADSNWELAFVYAARDGSRPLRTPA